MTTFSNIILQQLGGNRFVSMTGAKDFVSYPYGVLFSIGRGAINKANKVQVTIQPNDLYTVEFRSIRGVKLREVSRHEDVAADCLQGLFTEQTGMDCYL